MCSTAPEFERTNWNDPDAPNFVPNRPTNLAHVVNENGSVSLIWLDNTSFETGYRVYKSTNGEPLQFFTNLEPNTTVFTDTTKELGIPTQYGVTAFRDSAESFRASRTIADFGTISNLEISLNIPENEISLTWIEFVDFAHGYNIKRKSDITNTEVKVTEVEFPGVLPRNNSVDVPRPTDGFVQTYTVSPFLVSGTDTVEFSSLSRGRNSGGPSNVTQSFITSDSLRIEWEDNSSLEEGFELSVTIRGVNYLINLPPNTTSYTFTNSFTGPGSVISRVVGFASGVRSPSSASAALVF